VLRRLAPAAVVLIALPAAWAVSANVMRSMHASLAAMFIAIVALEWASVAAVFALRTPRRSPYSPNLVRVVIAGAAVSLITLAVALPHVAAGQRLLLVVLTLAGAPTAGLAEEFLFRGVAIDTVTDATKSVFFAVTLSTISFALLHQPSRFSEVEYYAAFGLVMWVIRRLSRSLLPGTLIHWAWDAVVAAAMLTSAHV
jgi:membrane protease YdiL (CAAX protease family)